MVNFERWRQDQVANIVKAHEVALARRAPLDAVRAIHQPKKIWESDRTYTLICSACVLSAYPCETIRALGDSDVDD